MESDIGPSSRSSCIGHPTSKLRLQQPTQNTQADVCGHLCGLFSRTKRGVYNTVIPVLQPSSKVPGREGRACLMQSPVLLYFPRWATAISRTLTTCEVRVGGQQGDQPPVCSTLSTQPLSAPRCPLNPVRTGIASTMRSQAHRVQLS